MDAKQPLEHVAVIPFPQLYRDGVYGDCCSTVIVGEGDPVSLQLVSVTEQCLLNSIKECRPGASFSAIGKCIR